METGRTAGTGDEGGRVVRPWTLILSLLLLGLAACGATRPLLVVNWNTYHLFDDQTHQDEAAAWLADQRPAMVALQEVHHVDAAGLATLAAGWGHDHAVMHKESGYPVALTSSAPIEVVERRVEGFHHGYLHARTHGFDVFVVHFWPGEVDGAGHVAERARALAAEGRAVLVMGDFNTEIRHDEEYLREHGLIDGEIHFDFRITDAFLSAGFVDLTHRHDPEADYTFGSPALIPRWKKDMRDVRRVRRRIDIVFADAVTARRARSAKVVTDDATVGRWSDHYPVLVALDR
ncbi:MAG: endonuclease/exonuclease/phosphatase family protein [Planctomycetota bacterium]